MPEMTIRLIPDPDTGKKNIIISLRGDEDALPHEHEQMHRRLVEKVIGKGLVQAEEIGEIIVEREQIEKAPPAPAGTEPAERQKASEGR